jgi:hypothetical protein
MAHSRKQKSRGDKRRNKSHKRSRSHSRRRLQKGGGNMILTPAQYANSPNAHFGGIGFTDPTGAVTGCTGGGAGNIYTTIGGIKTPVAMNGGALRCAGCNRRKCVCKVSCARCNRRKCTCKNKSKRRMQRGGNTNGYSIGGVKLEPSLSGIANNLHTPFDSCIG